MNDPHVISLTRRLDRLERENRRWRRAGAGVVIAVASFALTGQAMQSRVPKSVEAERFALRDTSGRVRAALGMEPDGAAGKTRAGVGVTREGLSGMGLFDQAGKSGVSLALGQTALASAFATRRIGPDFR